MDQAVPVGFDRRISHLMRDVAGEAERERGRGHRHFEVRSRHEFHHEVGNRGVIWPCRWFFAGVDGRHDIRMAQLTDRASFLEEASQRARTLVRCGMEGLDRDRSAKLPVLAAIDHAHAARADAVENAIVAEQKAVSAGRS